jgi:hypothetical protein
MQIAGASVIVLFVGGFGQVLSAQYLQWGYNDATMHLSPVLRSDVHASPTSPGKTCGHFAGQAMFTQRSVNLGTISLGADYCWDGVVVEQASLTGPAFSCATQFPIVIWVSRPWCNNSLDNPATMTGGANFVLSPLANPGVCEHGWLRIDVNSKGALADRNGVAEPAVQGAIAPGCAFP